MSSSQLHPVVIKSKDDEQFLKRFEVNAPERKTEPGSRQVLLIQLKDVSSCQSGLVKNDPDFYTCETSQQNQNSPRIMRKFVYLNMGRMDVILRNLTENKDQLLKRYVRELLEHNIHFNELDLAQNQLLFEVFLKDEADIDETMDMCLTPFRLWSVEESKQSSYKPSFTTLNMINDGSGNHLPLYSEERLISDHDQDSHSWKERANTGIKNEESRKERTYTDIENEESRKERANTGIENEESRNERANTGIENEESRKEKANTGIENEESRNERAYTGIENEESVSESKDSKRNRKEYDRTVTSDEHIEETMLKDKEFERASRRQKALNRADFSKLTGQGNYLSGNVDSDVISVSKVRDATDVNERSTKKTPASRSLVDKSSTKTVAEQNLNKDRTIDIDTDRAEYIIEGVEQELVENDSTCINETDVTTKMRNMFYYVLRHYISGNSEAFQRIQEVYVKMLTDMSVYKYYYYYHKSTPQELVLLLIAGLNEEKGSKFKLSKDHDRRLVAQLTDASHSFDAHLSFDAHHKRYRNDKSKKWASVSQKGSQIKDSEKSGRLSPEGGNEIGDQLVVPSKEKERVCVEPTSEVLKAYKIAVGKRPCEGSRSSFFQYDPPETDGFCEAQGNAVHDQHDGSLGNIVSSNSPETPSGGGRHNVFDPSSDTVDPVHNSSHPGDDDHHDDESSQDVNDTDDDSDFSCDEDFPNRNPGMRTVPEGSQANSRGGGGAIGALGEAVSTADRYKTFLKSWNVNLGDSGEECLCAALQGCESEQNPAPSTMFLLDLSKSMEQEDKISQMKAEIRSILQEAGSKHLRGQMSETYGVAVFGHKTEVLLYPTVHLHEVLDTLDLQSFTEPDGRSPLGLGLLLCTCVWFSEKGTGGAVWLHGRKIKPRIIVITDMKINEIASRAGMARGAQEVEEDRFEPESSETIDVKNELIQIALKLGALEIPVHLVPVGDTRQVRSHLEGVIKMTGGTILDKNGGQLGRQTWQQINACNILKMITSDWGDLSEEHFQLMIKTYTGDDPGDTEIIQRIIAARQANERKEANIKSLIRQTGEPGEQLWRDLPLGERVQEIHDADLMGTVVGHLPEKKILVQWDKSPTGELECREMTDLRRGTPRDCGEYFGETHLIGSRVRKILPPDGADASASAIRMDNTDVGTVLTLSALQPSVVYVAWGNDQICRHSSFDICRFQERDRHYEFDHYWLFCDNGQWLPFPRENSRLIEEKKENNPSLKTMVMILGRKQYRLMFLKNLMKLTNGQHVSYLIHRQAMIPP